MQNAKCKMQNRRFLFCFLFFVFCPLFVFAQSTSQDFPTPVKSNEITGKIPARDVGDSRLTSFYYTFNGTQGDVFINVEAANLNGDIDVFTAGNLRPLTKIPLYAGDTTVETGRVIYLRKPEKLILRIEARTPNDNPATFRIKFAGSFVASNETESEEPKLPEVKPDDKSGIRVNSVGTIIEVKPKPTPQPKETVAETEKKEEEKKTEEEIKPENKPVETETEKEEKKSAEVVVTDETPKPETETPKTETKKTVKTPVRRTTRRNARNARTKTQPKTEKTETAENNESKPVEPETKPVETAPKKPAPKSRRTQPPKETKPDPMANFRLIVLFKDGTKIERPMTEILRVNVDKGILTVISKDGTIGRYSIADVLKMSIE